MEQCTKRRTHASQLGRDRLKPQEERIQSFRRKNLPMGAAGSQKAETDRTELEEKSLLCLVLAYV